MFQVSSSCIGVHGTDKAPSRCHGEEIASSSPKVLVTGLKKTTQRPIGLFRELLRCLIPLLLWCLSSSLQRFNAPIAQLEEAADLESAQCEFESL